MTTALSELEWAILKTVAYADIFSFPLTPEEIQRYLIEMPATMSDVNRVLYSSHINGTYLVHCDGYVSFAGRENIVQIRQQRRKIAANLWDAAWHYGRWIGQLPFVRMVAVTGSLAVDNTDRDGDIDFLVITEPGRLWLCRLFIVALVKWVERQGYTLCPNYIISENVMLFEDQNLFTAREIAQMVPVAGLDTYQKMRYLNNWSNNLFPNAADAPPVKVDIGTNTPLMSKKIIESVFRTPLGAWIDQWEMNHKIRKLMHQGRSLHEVDFRPDACKGHFDGHRQRILDAYQERLHMLEQKMGQEI